MPKYTPQKVSLRERCLAFLLLFLGILTAVFIIWKAPYILLFAPVVFIWSYFDDKNWQKRISNLALERKGHNIGTFAKSFDCKSVDTWVIRAVYEQLQQYVSTEKTVLPILSDDHLFNTLNIDKEDLADILMEEIAQRTSRSFDSFEKNPYFDNLNTVKDLVYFFDKQPTEAQCYV